MPLAEQGEAEAQYQLGMMHERGRGVPKDYKQALKWIRLTAEQGHAGAQYWLAVMYRNGLGVLKDSIQAYAWFNIAGANGDKEANEIKAELNLTPASIERAQALSRKLDGRISNTQGAGKTPCVQTAEPQTKHKTIYNACLLDKSLGFDMPVGSLRRAVEETCKSIAQDPSWIDRLRYDYAADVITQKLGTTEVSLRCGTDCCKCLYKSYK